MMCALLLVCAAGCPKASPPPDAGVAIVIAEPTRAGEDIVPVLEDKGPIDPRAARLCRAVHGAAAERRATCCATKPGGVGNVEVACASAVSAALKGKGLTIDDAQLSACELAQTAELADCGWVRALPPATPPACVSLLAGALGEGARCRSSLECAEGQRCHGASLLDTGRCGPPRRASAPCGGSVDALALAVGQNAIDARHPECEGHCALGRCAAFSKAEQPCRAARECGAGNRCEAGVCKAGLIALGGACAGASCVDGARCRGGTCMLLSAAGALCRDDFDCARGGCVDGRCGMRCTR